ncbi:hypothetical protein E8P77_09655 [Soehngenia saccharolytica]|nr:hypothetical protein E8P77_09655 [Soehngenia saccharolytica]
MEKKRKKLIIFLSILILTFIIIIIMPILSFSEINTIKPKKLMYEKKQSFNSVIIRDEVLQLDSEAILKIDKLAPEAKLVPKGSLIATVTKSDGQKYEIYSNCSGFVSFDIDGYENIDINAIKSMDDTDLNYLFGEQSSENRIGIKIIDSYIWYLIVDVDDNFYENYINDDTVKIKTDNSVDRYIDTRLVAKSKTKNHNILILESSNFIQEFIDGRKLEISIIEIQEQAYKIPNSALTQKDGVVGVFIKEYYGVIGFRPIEIIDSNDAYVYASIGDENGNILIKDEYKKTIDEHSDIILDPDSVEYGSIIK